MITDRIERHEVLNLQQKNDKGGVNYLIVW